MSVATAKLITTRTDNEMIEKVTTVLMATLASLLVLGSLALMLYVVGLIK